MTDSVSGLDRNGQEAAWRAASEALKEHAPDALEYIARGYSGSLEGGNAQGHSGTYCAEVARRALSEPDKEGT